jgi:hypothetical protein
MTLFLENSFSLNNYISISERIKNIPMYFLYFVTIDSFKNLDEHYKVLPISNSSLVQREIRHKIIYIDKNVNIGKNGFYTEFATNFAKYIYQIFHACSILRENKISFTLSSHPFISSDSNLPQLYDFSYSFYFPNIQFHNLKLYFSPSLIQNPYISLDVFLITHLLYHPIDKWCSEDTEQLSRLFLERREKIDINSIKKHLSYFHNYNSKQVIQYLFQFKYTWTYYSLCYFFIIHYSDLLKHFSLYETFNSYIHSSFKDRNADLVHYIHRVLFYLETC